MASPKRCPPPKAYGIMLPPSDETGHDAEHVQ
jgi:hypothetical protein